MKLSREESQALAFIAAMILVSAAARLASRPGPVEIHGDEVSIAELQESSLALMTPRDARATAAGMGWVNVNSATERDFAQVPKVGAALAAAIVAHRQATGRIAGLDDLLRVPGMKKAALEALADVASFGTWDDPTRLTPPLGSAALQEPQKPRARATRPPAGGEAGRPTGTTGRSSSAGRAPAGGGAPSVRAGTPTVVRRRSGAGATPSAIALIPINDASSVELQRLPGVGPALAQRIIDHRQQHGAFRTAADLDAVKGIGPALLAKIAPLVRF